MFKYLSNSAYLMGNKTDSFVVLLLLFVGFLGLIDSIFNMNGWKFYAEVLVLLGLLFLSILALLLLWNKVSFGYVLSACISFVMLLNLLLFYFVASMDTLLFLALVSTLSVFVLSVMGIGGKEPEVKSKPAPKPKVIKTYTSGKVVSSKSSKYYYLPTSSQAKKISKKNQVWYDSDEDAKKAGKKPHSSVI